MPASVAIPAVRQKRSKLAPTCCQASSTIAAGTIPASVVDFSMALLSFADSAPRAYWLKAGNAYLTFSTSTGTCPRRAVARYYGRLKCDPRIEGRAHRADHDKGISRCPRDPHLTHASAL